MGFLRFVVWSALCIGLGIFLGTYQLGGRTPWQAMQGAWSDQAAPRLDEVKKKLGTDAQPTERHSEEDRKAVDAIISKRSRG